MDYFHNSMGLVENCFIMRNTLNVEKPNDKFEGVDKEPNRSINLVSSGIRSGSARRTITGVGPSQCRTCCYGRDAFAHGSGDCSE